MKENKEEKQEEEAGRGGGGERLRGGREGYLLK